MSKLASTVGRALRETGAALDSLGLKALDKVRGYRGGRRRAWRTAGGGGCRSRGAAGGPTFLRAALADRPAAFPARPRPSPRRPLS